MKKYVTNLLGKFLNGIIFGGGVVIVLGVYSVYSAYTTISLVANGDKLTSGTFNTLVSNVDSLNVKVNSLTSSSFGDRIAAGLGTTYQAATDGLLIVIGRTDGATGGKRVSVVADNSSTPTTVRGEADGYNNGNRLGSYQLTIPIKKGEYYKILCAGAATCGGTYFIGGFNAYFVPMGS